MRRFTSNTAAGSGNQYVFRSDGQLHTGRAFYKIAHGGSYNYSLLFTNTIDSTFADGSVSRKNMVCPQWQIHGAKIGRCQIVQEDIAFTPITFCGKAEKTVQPGDIFWTDPICAEFEKGDYLCLEMTFSGTLLPYHEESLLPIFRLADGTWAYDKRMPLPGMIGCDRSVKKRIAFLGDSITQGIGTQIDSYDHWCALLSEKLGSPYACWNLGLGYGRANDMASDGAWLQKAKQNDIVFVCCGVNDLLQGFSGEQIKKDIQTIVRLLKQEGIAVVLQTIPPFDYSGELVDIWKRLNEYIKTLDADWIFDNVPILGAADAPQMAIYDGHPNGDGCKVLADALYEFLTGGNACDL